MNLEKEVKKYFKRLNPDVPVDSIDFHAYVDHALTLEENIANLKELFPVYNWEKKRQHARLFAPIFKTLKGIDISKLSKPVRVGRMHGDVVMHGYDTETDSHGNLLVVANETRALGNRPYLSEILDFLFQPDDLPVIGWFFNIRFDVDAIFKPVVDKLNLVEGGWELEYMNYKIRYYDGKFLRLAKGHKTIYYFDVSNFLDGSLETLAQKYLHTSKKDDKIEDKSHMEIYYDSDPEMVEEYCRYDAYITQQLALWLYDSVESMSQRVLGFRASPAKWYSKASIAEFIIKHAIDHKYLKPDVPLKAIEYAYRSYKGGMFELYVKGKVEDATTIDINSAYPTQIRELIDVNNGEWRHVDYFDPRAYYGFYRTRANYNGFMPARASDGRIYYPHTYDRYEYYATQQEIEKFGIDNFEVLDGWVYYPDEQVKPFKNLIDKLYQIKKESKGKDPTMYWLVKVIINSIYGKFVQTRGGKVGDLFNPIWGSVITTNTRLQIYDLAQKFDEVYSIDTDSITGRISDERLAEIPLDDELGHYSVKERNVSKILVMNGISMVKENDEFKILNSRGFSRGQITEFKIVDNKIIVNVRRPVHLREALRQGIIDKINQFNIMEKSINLDEAKRIFTESFSFDRKIESFPYNDELFGDWI